MNIFIDVLFIVIGALSGIFCLGQLFHIIFFSIPFTQKLKKLKILRANNPILKRYIKGLAFWLLVLFAITFFVFKYSQFSNKTGYMIGAIVFFFPASGITKWKDKTINYFVVFDEYIDKDKLNEVNL